MERYCHGYVQRVADRWPAQRDRHSQFQHVSARPHVYMCQALTMRVKPSTIDLSYNHLQKHCVLVMVTLQKLDGSRKQSLTPQVVPKDPYFHPTGLEQRVVHRLEQTAAYTVVYAKQIACKHE